MYIIAECGISHQGDITIAKEMIYKIAEAGADAVKFQAYKTNKLTGCTDKELEYCKKAELDYDQLSELMGYANQAGRDFIVSPFDYESIGMLYRLGLTAAKIPSGQITDYDYLENISRTFPDVILSTGMCNVDDIYMALGILGKGNQVTLLHCTSAYPVPFEDVNLNAIHTMKKLFNLPVGLSDHTLGIEVPIAACALGADILEKHFTLDRTMDGPDHFMSVGPKELREMVKSIRNIEEAMGDGIKEPAPSEKETERRRK